MEPFIGTVMLFGGNFAPRGWAFCEGQLLAISSHSALFSILGTVYGGDGRTTFGLPDLRGRVAIEEGSGPGLDTYRLGQQGGAPTTVLLASNLPSHNHTLRVPINNSELGGESTGVLSAAPIYAEEPTTNTYYQGTTIGFNGANTAFNNMQPYLAIHYIIALEGIYPSRS